MDYMRVLQDTADGKIEPAHTPPEVREAAMWAYAEITILNLRIQALESALADLLDSANPHTYDEQLKYEDCARHAELILRGGEPEGQRKPARNLD